MGPPAGQQGRRPRGPRGAADRCLRLRCRGLACLPYGPLEEKARDPRRPQPSEKGQPDTRDAGCQTSPGDGGVSTLGPPDQGLAALLLGCCAGGGGGADAESLCGLLADGQAGGPEPAARAPALPRGRRSGPELWRRARDAVLGKLRAASSTPRANDEGALVVLSTWSSADQPAWYCGRALGHAAVPNEDGRCGPHEGPQCASCARYQQAHPPLAASPLKLKSAGAIASSFVDARRLQSQAWRVEIHAVRGLRGGGIGAARSLSLLGAIGGRLLDSTPSLAVEVASGDGTHRIEVSSPEAVAGEVLVDHSLVVPRPPPNRCIVFRVFFESAAGDRAPPLLGVAAVSEPAERVELELYQPRDSKSRSYSKSRSFSMDSIDASLGLGAATLSLDALFGGGPAVLVVSVTEVPLGSAVPGAGMPSLARAISVRRKEAVAAAARTGEGVRGCLVAACGRLGCLAAPPGPGAGGREDGRAFMAERAAEAGTKRLACGLLYKVLKQGRGQRRPGLNTLCSCRFSASTFDGEYIDGSGEHSVMLLPRKQRRLVVDDQGRRAEAGGCWWSVALRLMVEEDEWELYVPPELAFGKLGMGAVPPDAFLVVNLELKKVWQDYPVGAPCEHTWTWRPRVQG